MNDFKFQKKLQKNLEKNAEKNQKDLHSLNSKTPITQTRKLKESYDSQKANRKNL
jgi:hypothetical protein